MGLTTTTGSQSSSGLSQYFAIKVAGEYRHLGLPFEDLLNEGNLGILAGARRREPFRPAPTTLHGRSRDRPAVVRHGVE